ncbi:MAG: prepilin-type N-terminal cleavage/methylation domain-containing protein [Phycisphaerales bacterium]|nr:prepilin-type N-terminal cleavage/methylation domain-containing protein [Phycisphaerales bacterium]
MFSHATTQTTFSSRGRGFSLVELLVVMAITGVLTALLLPTLATVRESANRVISSSNQRTIGQGLTMFASDNKDQLPRSRVIEGVDPRPSELMVARYSSAVRNNPTGSADIRYRNYANVERAGWDGLGLLYFLHYEDDANVFYCPSHSGEHSLDRYEENWLAGVGTIYTNYHYSGHMNWKTGMARRFTGARLVLLSDGLRRRSDLSHETGLNVLKGDGSVRWHELPTLLAQLPMESPMGDALRAHQDLISELFNDNGLIK